MLMKNKSIERTAGVSRRAFMKTPAAGAAAILAGRSVIFAAGAKRKLKIALIGRGGRGNGALDNCMEAATHIDGVELELVATADWFKQKAESTGEKYKLSPSKCFGGGNAYKQLLETNVDVVLIATSPNFRPVHFEAAVKAGKHVFMEKPVARDPPGARNIIEAGDLAKKNGLGVVAGTQRRHQAN